MLRYFKGFRPFLNEIIGATKTEINLMLIPEYKSHELIPITLAASFLTTDFNFEISRELLN